MPRDDIEDIDLLEEQLDRRVGPEIELGVSGLRRSSGIVDEEFLPQLRGRRAVSVYREMRENSPVVGAWVFAMDRLLRGVEWKVTPPGSSDKKGRAKAEFLESVKDDMSHTWDEFISEALTMIVYGWSWHEIVYKRRGGMDHDDPTRRSLYNDGKVGWRKLPLRSQETMQRWIFDSAGGIRGMVQLAPPLFKMTPLPIEKSLLFRTMSIKNNPEGYSLLRNAYQPYYYMKRTQEHEAVGIERDLAGMPTITLPMEYITAPANTENGKVMAGMRRMIRNIRRDNQEGVIFPKMLDQDGNDLFEFKLLGGGGTRQFNTDEVIRRYSEQILMSVLSDFIMLGQAGGSGSYAMHTDKSGLFRAGINSISQSIADVLNKHAVPRLWKENGWKLEDLPQFEPSNVDPPDLAQLASLVSSMSNAGMTFFPDAELEDQIRDFAGISPLKEDEREARDVEQAQAELLRLAEQRTQLVTMSAQARSATAGQAAVGAPPGAGPAQAPGGQAGPPQPAPAAAPDLGTPPAAEEQQIPDLGAPKLSVVGKRLHRHHEDMLRAAPAKVAENPAVALTTGAASTLPPTSKIGVVGRAAEKARKRKIEQARIARIVPGPREGDPQ